MAKNKYGKNKAEILTSMFTESVMFEAYTFPNPYLGTNHEIELCECIFILPFATLIIEVKESESSNRKSEEKWLNKKIKEASFQLSRAVKGIQNNELIYSNSKEIINFNRKNIVLSLIIFDNPNIDEYSPTIEVDSYKINIFSIDKYKDALENIRTIKEFAEYLPWRYEYFTRSANFEYPICKTKAGLIIANPLDGPINNNEKFASSKYIYSKYPNEPEELEDQIRLHSLCKLFSENNNREFLELFSKFDYLDLHLFFEKWKYLENINLNNKIPIKGYALTIRDNNECLILVARGMGSNKEQRNFINSITKAEAYKHKPSKIFILEFEQILTYKGYNLYCWSITFKNEDELNFFIQDYIDFMNSNKFKKLNI